MFIRKNFVTICTKSKYAVDIEQLICDCIKTKGNIDVYSRNEETFTTICTSLNVDEVANIMKEKFYKSETSIHGNTIFVDFD